MEHLREKTNGCYLHKFVVEGRGAFPFDMLRYDSCWPASETDSGVMERTFRRVEHGNTARVTLKRLAHSANAMPTTDRWSSFGWTVVEVRATT